MRTAVRCVVAVIATAASVVAGPADATLAAANQSNGFAVASVLPTQGEVVGVAHPVVVTFRSPIANRRAAERAMDVKSAPAMTGKFDCQRRRPDHRAGEQRRNSSSGFGAGSDQLNPITQEQRASRC